MPGAKNDPASVDRYLAGLPADQRQALEDLRARIRAALPDADERVSYGDAIIFSVKRDIVGFNAREKHLSFFTMSPGLARSLKDEIKATHKVSGATIHFSPEQPLPDALLEKIIQARLQENAALR
jgi:uncharacterized protein YdhG (YjbR/CyaY superfamily)